MKCNLKHLSKQLAKLGKHLDDVATEERSRMRESELKIYIDSKFESIGDSISERLDSLNESLDSIKERLDRIVSLENKRLSLNTKKERCRAPSWL